MKALIVLLAAVPAAGALVFTVFLVFVATFPWENRDPSWVEGRSFPLLLTATGAVFLFSSVLILGVAVDRPWLATAAFVAQAAVAGALLAWGLSASEHSDDKVIAFAAACETPGLIAVLLNWALGAADAPA